MKKLSATQLEKEIVKYRQRSPIAHLLEAFADLDIGEGMELTEEDVPQVKTLKQSFKDYISATISRNIYGVKNSPIFGQRFSVLGDEKTILVIKREV